MYSVSNLRVPDDISHRVHKILYDGVIDELWERYNGKDMAKAFRVKHRLPALVTGGWIDGRGIFRNDRSMPRYETIMSVDVSIFKKITVPRDGDVLMKISIEACHRAQMYSYDFFGSSRTVWDDRKADPKKSCVLEPFEDGMCLLQLGTAIYIDISAETQIEESDSAIMVSITCHWACLPSASRRSIADFRDGCNDDRGMKMIHKSGRLAQIFGCDDMGRFGNRLCFV